jgi:hypothetical protein
VPLAVIYCSERDRSYDSNTGKERFDMTPLADLPPGVTWTAGCSVGESRLSNRTTSVDIGNRINLQQFKSATGIRTLFAPDQLRNNHLGR